MSERHFADSRDLKPDQDGALELAEMIRALCGNAVRFAPYSALSAQAEYDSMRHSIAARVTIETASRPARRSSAKE